MSRFHLLWLGGVLLWGHESLAALRRCPLCSSQKASPTLVDDTQDVAIPQGCSTFAIVNLLAQKGVLRSPLFFLARVVLTGSWGRLQSGLYRFPSPLAHGPLLTALKQGHVLLHKITIPEGVTVAMAFDILTKHPCLTGRTPGFPLEGHLLPGTYLFSTGDTREKLVGRMERAMERQLSTLVLPHLLVNREHLLILASIVEKETCLAEEKPLVAGVFLNRLRKKMPLQADPTLVYGLTLGTQKLNRRLTRADLKKDGLYNSYTRRGLPPTPICCPSTETLQIVAKATPGPYLFFVADGKGGHRFSTTISEHNNNVQAFKQARYNTAAGNNANPKEGKCTRDDSNVRPLPSEGNALSS